MEINLHGFTLNDALDEICYRLEECQASGHQEITLIHGHRHRAVIKEYIRSEGFIREMQRNGFRLKRKKTSNPGVSHFILI